MQQIIQYQQLKQQSLMFNLPGNLVDDPLPDTERSALQSPRDRKSVV